MVRMIARKIVEGESTHRYDRHVPHSTASPAADLRDRSHQRPSRTLLFDITRLTWDHDLCKTFSVPPRALAECARQHCVIRRDRFRRAPETTPQNLRRDGRFASVLFAHRCLSRAWRKVTIGSGSSVLLNLGPQLRYGGDGACSTVAWTHGGGRRTPSKGSSITPPRRCMAEGPLGLISRRRMRTRGDDGSRQRRRLSRTRLRRPGAVLVARCTRRDRRHVSAQQPQSHHPRRAGIDRIPASRRARIDARPRRRRAAHDQCRRRRTRKRIFDEFIADVTTAGGHRRADAGLLVARDRAAMAGAIGMASTRPSMTLALLPRKS